MGPGGGGQGEAGGGGAYTHPHRFMSANLQRSFVICPRHQFATTPADALARFERYNYTTPVSCDLCTSILWGIVRTGYRCDVR